MAREPAPGYWWVALASFAVGIAVGLGAAWGFWPVQVVSDRPADLQSSYKDDYIRMISAAYEMDGNLSKAKLRLSQLGPGTPSQIVGEFTLRENNRNNSPRIQASLKDLAAALGTSTVERSTGLETRSIAGGNAVSSSNLSAIPVFRVVERVPLTCSEVSDRAQMRFIVRDTRGSEMPNVGIEVRSTGTDETIFTGLKPERGIGYADLEVIPGTFSVNLLSAALESPVQFSVGAAPADCSSDRGATPRGWKVVLQQK